MKGNHKTLFAFLGLEAQIRTKPQRNKVSVAVNADACIRKSQSTPKEKGVRKVRKEAT
jgi:hypothetical protein